MTAARTEWTSRPARRARAAGRRAAALLAGAVLVLAAGLGSAAADDRAGGRPPGSADTDGALASAFIDAFTERAAAVLRDETLPLEERDAAFRGFLLEGFDTEHGGRFALGRGWRIASPAQRDEYIGLFRDDLLRAGKELFLGYGDETLKVVRAVALENGDLLVSTRLTNPEAAINDIDFRLRVFDGRYRIVDVVLEGFSMLNAYRTEFVEHLFRGGVEGVLSVLRRRTGAPAETHR